MSIASALHVDPEMRRCIENCVECHAICEHCAMHCLEMGGHHASQSHQTTMRDCAEICATSADFMVRCSPIHGDVCQVCAVACERCADECGGMADGDEMMLRCAEICRRCAESCRAMASSAGKAYAS
ncbi:MAG: four-helix bundle copper-binding protein [Fimbriimonas sp.]